MAAIRLRGLSGAARDDGFAVRGVDLDVAEGAVCAVIGPSGAGKTSLLRLVVGLDPVVAGSVWIGEDEVTSWPPQERNLGWFAQENPLYPHLDVGENIGFALRLRRLLRGDVAQRVQAEARAAGIGRLLRRMPSSLSAGERQAAGLARATVRVPTAYVLDEPLARIDAHERARLRVELARLFRGFETPVLLATNDQIEALALGDRLAVLRDGRLVQEGATQDVHGRPATVFVARFVGDSGMNILPGTLEAGARSTFVRVGDEAVQLIGLAPRLRARLDGRPVLLGVRPEHVRLGGAGAPLAAVVERVDLLGAARVLHTRLPAGQQVDVRVVEPARLERGERVRVHPGPAHLHLFDAQTEQALWHAADRL
jgi:multiple sugar transport system ATP-binding protein